jgi:predicted DNA-binding protein
MMKGYVYMVYIMSKDVRSKPGIYGETKKQKCFLLTDWASEELDRLAAKFQMTRSDLLERAIRAGGIEFAEDYKLNEEKKNQIG